VSHIAISAEIIHFYWQNCGQNGYLSSYQSKKKSKIKAKCEDATKTKYMTGLMDKAIAKVNQIQNELY